MAEKLSNVIGAPFDQYILDQLYIRAARNSTTQRSNEEILFLANKTSWARLISSVNITTGDNPNSRPLTDFYRDLGLGSNYTKPEDLARNWILEAGTSIKSGNGIALRSGIGAEGAYGLGGTEELGYRPMPGLSGVQIETVGRLGSLRQATISFKVWNMNQLNIVEALYFRLGYSMLLEWGHTQYFTNPTANTPGNTFTIATNTFGLDDPFIAGTNKTTVQQKIAKKSKETSGNYDGMLGIVSNFNWSFNQEGGYDCTVKLIGLGSIIDTIRINQSYKMPPGLVKPFKTAQQTIEDEIKRRADEAERERIKKEQQAAAQAAAELEKLTPVPKTFDELYTFATSKGGYRGDREEFQNYVSFYPSNLTSLTTPNNTPDYFYLADEVNADIYNLKQLGLFLQRESKFIPLHQESGAPFSVNTPLLELALNSTDSVSYAGANRSTLKINTLQTNTPYKSILTKIYNQTWENAARLNALYETYSTSYEGRVLDTSKTFTISVEFKNSNPNYTPLKEQVLAVLETWAAGFEATSKVLYLNRFETSTFRLTQVADDLFITAETARYTIKGVPYTGPSTNIDVRNTPGEIQVWFKFTFDNTALIESVNPQLPAQLPPTVTPKEAANLGDTAAAENTATAPQTEVAAAYESAFHVMLSYIKTVALAETTKASNTTTPVVKVSLLDATKAFYEDGILKDVFTPVPSANIFNTSPFNLTYYAQKGFNSNLLTDALTNPSLFEQVPSVNYQELCNAYLVQYQISNQATDNIEYPVYVSLGYLLAFLNNMCLLYDSKQKIGSNNSPRGGDKTPYVYVDFNPETNFCLTSPQHFSVDPRVCLIPFQGGNESYASIFPENIVTAISANLFKPKSEDFLSGQLPEFKPLAGNPYQGKTMNILLNVDFLVEVANGFISSNSEHSVDLQSFLNKVITEVNKSLGNINSFRVAYRDDSNTVQIKDDQWVPNSPNEVTILNKTAPVNPTTKLRLGELPVFGLQSLVRTFQFKTNISTKLGSMIAISAQAATGSVNATDPSSLSYLNANYQDRFKPYVVESTGQPAAGDAKNKATTTKKNDQSNNDLVVGEQFNTLVKSIYSNFLLDTAKIETAKNYYIERMSRKKSTDPVTSAAPFIPADLEITIDGIAGILMGNAFTIPESRLPLSLRGIEGKPKVGFIVAGLTHTIQENQWLTKIRGQMIKLRDVSVTDSVKEVNKIQTTLIKRRTVNNITAITGEGFPVTQSDIDFANSYTRGILPAVQLTDGTFQIARIEGDRYWLQPNPEYIATLVDVAVPTASGQATVKVRPDFAAKLTLAFNEVRTQGLQKYIVDTAGGLAVRNVTNGTALSFHAWGYAIDLNANLYGYGVNWNSVPQNEFNRGFEKVALILNRYGVGWFKSQDPMHFSIYESPNLQF